MKHKSGCQNYQGEMACENTCPIAACEIVLQEYPDAIAQDVSNDRGDRWRIYLRESGGVLQDGVFSSAEVAWVNAANQIDPGYNDRLDAEDQVGAEEAIAALLFDRFDALDEDDCADLGRDILKQVLHKFRPDLFEIAPAVRRKEE